MYCLYKAQSVVTFLFSLTLTHTFISKYDILKTSQQGDLLYGICPNIGLQLRYTRVHNKPIAPIHDHTY